MFDASVIANVLHISDGFHTAPFAIMASHTVYQRVSDRSVALAASCGSVVPCEERMMEAMIPSQVGTTLLRDAANATLRSETLRETMCDAIIANGDV